MRKNWFIRKLNNRAGESLPEVLIAVLIVAMGMLALSTMLNVSSKMVDEGQAKVQAIYKDVSELDNGMANGYGEAITTEAGKTVKIKYTLNGGNNISTTETLNATLYRGTKLISYDSNGMSQ